MTDKTLIYQAIRSLEQALARETDDRDAHAIRDVIGQVRSLLFVEHK